MKRKEKREALARMKSSLITKGFALYAVDGKSASYRRQYEETGGHHDVLIVAEKWLSSVRTNEAGEITSNISVQAKTESDIDFLLAQL
jgi:hypothetical protein